MVAPLILPVRDEEILLPLVTLAALPATRKDVAGTAGRPRPRDDLAGIL